MMGFMCLMHTQTHKLEHQQQMHKQTHNLDFFKPLSETDTETGLPTGEPRVEGPTTKLPPDAAEVKYLFEFLTPHMLEVVCT